MEKILLRPSGIQQFVSCPYQWYNVHVLQKPQKPKAASRAGTSLHKAAEVGYSYFISKQDMAPLEDCLDAGMEEWHRMQKEEQLVFEPGETSQDFEDQIKAGIISYYGNIMPERVEAVQAVEQRYTVEVNNPIIEAISGTLDIDMEDYVADIKFTSKKATGMSYVLQQSTYALLKEKNGKSCKFAELHNVTKTKGYPADFVPVPVKLDYAKFWINKILETCEEFYNTGNENIWRGTNPNSYYLCSPKWCGFWEQCPYVAGLR